MTASQVSSMSTQQPPAAPVADSTDVDARLFAQGDAAFAGSDAATARTTASPVALLRDAMGGPREMAGKARRFAAALYYTVNIRETRRRLERLRARGFMGEAPNQLQLIFGGLDMLRYFIKPGAEGYYGTKGINPAFHYLLRVLDDPSSMIDPVGIRSPRDTIIGHVLQVVHANPAYDFQLLEMFNDGLDEMELQTKQMIDGSHPRYRSISAIIEDPEYFDRLLDYITRYRQDPKTPQLIRKTGEIRQNPHFVLAEMTFGTLPAFMRYANRLPKTLPGLLRHYRKHPVINPAYCDPQVVEAHAQLFDQ